MLEGIRVVELATMVAAPAAAGLLAEWGASVIKIEPHSGDPMRGTGGVLGSTNFDLHNRTKRSIALNTKCPETRVVILKMVEKADIFVTNMLPAALAKLKLDWPDLHSINPRLVYATVTSFGRVGPEKDRPAMDNAGFWARGGGTSLLTVKGQDPLPIRQSVGDRITGMSCCAGILAALVEAQRTGKGRLVDTSLLRAGVWTFGTDITNQLNKGRTASSKGRREAVIPLANYFKTRDDRWILLHTNIQTLAPLVGRADLANDERFSTPAKARENGPALVDEVDRIIAERTLAEWKELFDKAKIICEPVQTPADVVADPQAQAAGCFIDLKNPDGSPGRYREVASPQTFYAEDGSYEGVPTVGSPRIGEHTVEILHELGYHDVEIATLRRANVIPPQPDLA